MIPILRRVTPFNAETDFTFTFFTAGSSQQIFYNRLIIKLSSDTSQTIYDEKIQEFRYQHTVPADTLTNGEQYVAQVEVFSQADSIIGVSEPIFFYCLGDITLTIPTIENGEVFNQTVLFQGSYSQPQDDDIQSFTFVLYNDNKDEISRSPEIFSSDIEYEFSQLENRQKYYIELKVTTVSELGGATGLIEFTPRYIAPRFESAIEVENIPDTASVMVKCNVIRIIGEAEVEPVIYEDDGAVNLIDNVVWFEDGFKLKGNWTIQLWLRDIVDDSVFFKMIALDGSCIELKYKNNRINMKKMLDNNYITQSLLGELDIDNDKTIYICLKHIDGLYDFNYNEVIE